MFTVNWNFDIIFCMTTQVKWLETSVVRMQFIVMQRQNSEQEVCNCICRPNCRKQSWPGFHSVTIIEQSLELIHNLKFNQ
jgi:hypothetical protein